MMTTAQMKAARALLDWTQQDLAKAAGLHLNVINNIERGTSNPRQQTVDRLKAALEAEGVVFLGTRGVELARDAVAVTKWEGDDCLARLIDDILAHVRTPQDEVLNIIADIRNFAGHDPQAGKKYAAERASRGFSERLVTRAMPGFYPRGSESYRVVAPDMLGPVDTVIYGDRVAHLFWNAPEILVLRNADLAVTQRRVFEHLWNAGHEPVRMVRAAED